MSPRYPNRLKQLRGRRFTQEELAERIGVNPSTYRSWEDGSHRPRPRYVRALCQQLGVDEHELGYDSLPMEGAAQERLRDGDDDLPPAVRRSQEQWHEVRHHLARYGTELVIRSSKLYGDSLFIGSSNAFTHPDWLLSGPLSLDQVAFKPTLDAPPPLVNGSEPEARLILPLHSPGHLYDRYSTAIRHLDRPRLFENRPSYRLLSIDHTDNRAVLDFGLANYFDKVDVSETLAHEFTLACLNRTRRRLDSHPTRDDLPFRGLIGDPALLRRRPVLPGVITLTLRRAHRTNSTTMLLHLRDPSRVAIGGRVHTLIPCGEFQPASVSLASYHDDLDLWHNMVRELSEELLDMPEHDGSHGTPLDYDGWPLYRSLTAALHDQQIRVLLLGFVFNPLSLGLDLLTVAVFNDDIFDASFPQMRRSNSEGRIVTQRPGTNTVGIAFDKTTVEDLLNRQQLAPSSAACLMLAWDHRDRLLKL